MTFTYRVVKTEIDPVNFNLIATILYTDDVTTNTFSERFPVGVQPDVATANAVIDAQAAKRINNVLIPVQALSDPKTGIPINVDYPTPALPVPDPDQAALSAAALALQTSLQQASVVNQVKILNDPTINQQLQDYQTALATVQTSQAAKVASNEQTQVLPAGP